MRRKRLAALGTPLTVSVVGSRSLRAPLSDCLQVVRLPVASACRVDALYSHHDLVVLIVQLVRMASLAQSEQQTPARYLT